MTEVWGGFPAAVPRSLMETSISGRMALAITCFERYCETKGIRDPSLEELIDKLWEFVERDDLDKWESEVYGVTKDLMDAVKRQRKPADPLFVLLPAEGRQMLYTLIEKIGCGNLYAGTLGYSLDTLWPTLLVLRQAMDAGVASPDLGPFQRSRFSEFQGWGNRVPRMFFRG